MKCLVLVLCLTYAFASQSQPCSGSAIYYGKEHCSTLRGATQTTCYDSLYQLLCQWENEPCAEAYKYWKAKAELELTLAQLNRGTNNNRVLYLASQALASADSSMARMPRGTWRSRKSDVFPLILQAQSLLKRTCIQLYPTQRLLFYRCGCASYFPQLAE